MSQNSRMEHDVGDDDGPVSPVISLTQASCKLPASTQPTEIGSFEIEIQTAPLGEMAASDEMAASEGAAATSQELLSTPVSVQPDSKRRRTASSPAADLDHQVDLCRVIEELRKEIKNLKSDFIQTKRVLTEEVTEMKKSLEFQGAELDDMKVENRELKSVLDVVQGMSARNGEKTSGLHERVLEMECKLMGNDLVFHGIPEVLGTATGSLLETITGFLTKRMKVDGRTDIEKCFRVGAKRQGVNRPIIVSLVRESDKFKILKNGTNLKGTNFGVSERLPREYEERRKSLLPSFKEAKSKGVPARWSKDSLVVNHEIQKVRKDKVSDYNQDVIAEASKITVKRPPPHEGSAGSTLHTAKVAIAEARDVIPSLHAVMKVNRFATAKTSVYAYRIGRSSGQILEHFDDDGDNGAGRRLLALMRDKGTINQLLCISRHEGRPTTARARHGDIIDAAQVLLGL